MNQPKIVFSAITLLFVCFIISTKSFAQTDIKPEIGPSYDIVLQIVTGTNEGARSDLPQNLSAVSKQLRGNFSFSSYSLANTYLGRVANAGALNYKGVSDIFRPNAPVSKPSFVEWSVGNLRTTPGAGGEHLLQAQQFRFGARIPINIGGSADETGKIVSVTNYESIGLDLNRVTLAENTPTVIGTLTLPNTAGTLFLVMTAKPVEY
ncbi:MAG TPA: hypothetical protein VL325_09050 [Pyrinomonadaceae bacterium]|jgi:hypothetical protein|nr:hypothetical protein [Pyrinomonadaceae bacterium]